MSGQARIQCPCVLAFPGKNYAGKNRKRTSINPTIFNACFFLNSGSQVLPEPLPAVTWPVHHWATTGSQQQKIKNKKTGRHDNRGKKDEAQWHKKHVSSGPHRVFCHLYLVFLIAGSHNKNCFPHASVCETEVVAAATHTHSAVWAHCLQTRVRFWEG